MFSGDLATALHTLRASRWRTYFTMLGIIIGITSVVTIVSLGQGLKQQIVSQINGLGNDVLTVRPGKLLGKNGTVNNLNLYTLLAPSTLTSRDVASIQDSGLVRSTTPIEFVTTAASGDNGEINNLFVAGTNSGFGDTLRQQISYGAFFSDQEEDLNTAVIGSNVATNLYGVLNPVGETIHIMGQDFTIHGVLAPSHGGIASGIQADYNNSVFISTRSAQQLTGGKANILQILARLKPGVNIDKADKSINKIVLKNHGGSNDFTVLKPNQLVEVSSQIVGTVTKFISAIAAISLIVGGIGIMNIMLVSVTERTREIGIRKAIGATSRQIMRQFLVEGLVITIGGGILGIIFSLLINLLLRLYTSWKPVISIPLLLIAVGVSVVTGLVFSLIPAFKASQKDPITALRNE